MPWEISLAIAGALALVVIGVTFFIRTRREAADALGVGTEMVATQPIDKPAMTIQPSPKLSLVEEKEIVVVNRSGQGLTLSRPDTKTALSTKQYQEITARGSAIGANLIQGAMPALAEAQTLAQIAKAAPNGLYAATAPLSELMKYADGTVGSPVLSGSGISGHAGFQPIDLTVALNPAVVVAAAMQAMAMISGQYYMVKISKQLDMINRSIQSLIDLHHDQNIGRLRSVENRMREIAGKKHVDDTDVIALQSGLGHAESVLMEYSTRLERLAEPGKIADIPVRRMRSHLSAAKELQKLRANIEGPGLDLLYSCQICIYANRLMLESKKVEFATRLKTGEPEKAIESFDEFKIMYDKSFNEAADWNFGVWYKPIYKRANSLKESQWLESKKATEELRALKSKKAEWDEYIGNMADGAADEELILNFTEERGILYLPAAELSEQRVFISLPE